MLQSEVFKQYPSITKDGVTFTVRYECSDIITIYDKEGNVTDYELVDFNLINTPEEVSNLKPTKPQPTELELIKQELETLKLQQASFDESQTVQDMLIDDLVFEVIPSIEQQVQQGVEGVTLNNMISRGSEGMVGCLARKIIEGRDYRTVFKTNVYKQYQDEVDTILELEGHAHLIKRDELGVL